MKYKLYNDIYTFDNKLYQMLYNRGVDDPQRYTNLSEDCLCDYKNLCNINLAVKTYLNHIKKDSVISIIVDDDVDGFMSAAITYMCSKQHGANNVNYIIHKKAKTHGLSDDIEIPIGTKLLIIPDAGTNDYKQCEELSKNMDIIILDHHEKEFDNNYAIIVNNQMSPMYKNKNLCGAGIVYKFFKAVDEECWTEYADEYIDMVAVANIADNMDIREEETKYLIDLGIRNIKNKGLIGLINSLDFSMGGKINIHTIQFYPVPTMNGCIRVGDYEEKVLLFRSLIEDEEVFEYKKRATKNKPAEVIDEIIYDRAARLSKNAKARQDKLRTKAVKDICDYVDSTYDSNDKIIVIDGTEFVDRSLTGVTAIKIAEKYNKPCFVLQRHYEQDENGNDVITFGGSGRNFDNSPIENLKDIVNSTGVATALGHPNAHGIVGIKYDEVDKFVQILNDKLSDVDLTPVYLVDYIFESNDIDAEDVLEMAQIENYIGTKIKEPIIYVENIYLNTKDISVIGKNEDTIKFNINGIEFVQFKCQQGDELYDFVNNSWDDNESCTVNLIGKSGINNYNGLKIPQITIEKVEVFVNNMLLYDEDEAW